MVKGRKNNLPVDLEDSQLGQLKGKRDQVIAATKTLELAAQNASWAIKDFHSEFATIIGKLQNLSDEQIEALKSLNLAALPEKGVFLDSNNPLFGGRPAEEELTPTGRKKRKRVIDPLMPKKPMTVFLAFSTEQRAVIRAEREKRGLPPLINVDMANEVARLWGLLPEAAKEPYKVRYQEMLAQYHLRKERYLATKNPALIAAAANSAAISAAIEDDAEEDFEEAVEQVQEEERKEKRAKKEKGEKVKKVKKEKKRKE